MDSIESVRQRDKASGQVGMEGMQMFGSHDFMSTSKKKAFDLNNHGAIVKLPKKEEEPTTKSFGFKR